MLRFTHEKQKALLFTVSMQGNVEEYALNFLHIFNNVREYSYMFYSVKNNSGNDVFVTAKPEYKDEIKQYLEQFGEVYIDEINLNKISAQYDYNGWKSLFDEDLDTEFFVEID